MTDSKRKIPYNYTSADDERIIKNLFGSDLLEILKDLEQKKETGRSSRLLYRFMGDLFIINRNPFLFNELVEYPQQRKQLFSEFMNDLTFIEKKGQNDGIKQVLSACKKKLHLLQKKIKNITSDHKRIIKYLSPVVGKKNIYFDPFNITAHATDATDWRLCLPFAVLRPDKETQVPDIINKVRELGFNLIPRGGGTGLTGGATPLTDTCVILNTEKLNKISEIEINRDKSGRDYASINLEAGVITQDAIDFVKSRGYIFATDPTSAWACTIGGNLSENAGGKTAVLYGTAIDNVLSYKIVMPDASFFHIKRKDHPLRKILPQDKIKFQVFKEDGKISHEVELDGDQIRKKGLGKDVTNKSLNGLFGIQKEGCDGIITSAEFIVYPQFQYKKTFCIEFFGNDMSQAGQVIESITNAFPAKEPYLIALEHFDEEYVKAVKYKNKTSVGNRIIAVLLIDMVSNNLSTLDAGVDLLKNLLDQYDKTGLSIARSEEEAQRFWQDRKRLGAIAAHTNAFKLNEDIVLPIHSLSEFATYVDKYNLREKKFNEIGIIENIVQHLDSATPLSDSELFRKRVSQIKDIAFKLKNKLDIASRDALEAGIHSKNFFKDVNQRLRGYTMIVDQLEKIYTGTKSRLIVIATHMHAGDGNIHVNIPVFSNDIQMMERANIAADRVMEKAVELDGVVSGEHGIGITKFKHLDSQLVDSFEQYRKKIDPQGLMNPGKLSDLNALDKVFTPSFNLLELEARILKHGSLSELAMKIANCVRCGRCKPNCPVFYPARNMFFHPRNKNLSIGALIEALLYITQRTRKTGFNIFKNIEQIADHCTVCHKCFDKCPVDIDTGYISIEERNILAGMGFKKNSSPTALTLAYLGAKDRISNSIGRTVFLNIGAGIQRCTSKLISPFITDNSDSSRNLLLKTPVAKPDLTTLRTLLPKTMKNQALVLEPEEEAISNVFYFPGCGSERVFSKISMASIYLLLKNRNRVILPPSFICCGYPFQVNARKKDFETIVLENTIIFSGIRAIFSDLDFNGCIVSCGTCMEALNSLEADKIFSSEVLDIGQYILNQNKEIKFETNHLYHQPCHDSLTDNGIRMLKEHSNASKIKKLDHCCSEAGTMALSRPDISYSMFKRKQETLKNLNCSEYKSIITNCPSCLQGLGRLQTKELQPIHLAEELAVLTGGKNWKKQLINLLSENEVVPF